MAKAKEITAGTDSRLKKRQSNSKKTDAKIDRKPAAKPAAKPVVKKEKINRLGETKKYFKSVYNELKKVHWPTRREVLIYTGVVLVSVVIIGIIIWLFDSLLSRLLQFILR